MERLDGLTVAGWAFDPATPGQERLALACGAEVLEIVARRVPRQDVAQALGVAEPSLGVEFELPLGVWRALAEPDAALALRVNDTLTAAADWRPTIADLQRWPGTLIRKGQLAQAQAARAALGPHLAQAKRWSAPAAHDAPAAPLPSVGHVEGWRGLCLVGWLVDQADQREPVRLRCGGRVHEAPVRRVPRGDVARELGLEDDQVGFEIEVPGSLWREVAPDAALSLQVEFRSGPAGETYLLAREALPQRLADALADADPLQRGHQALLAMEHLAWAGAMPALDDSARQALAVLAESAGVSAWLHGDPALLARETSPARAPFHPGPRGRLGRWLLHRPANARRALGLLHALRRRPMLARLATRWEIMLTKAAGLFDKATYDEQLSPADRQGAPALRHYVEQGDARSLLPMALFDARHYTGQLEGRRHPGINRLLHYALVGRAQGLSPCAWFDPSFYLAANADVRQSGQEPLTHFMRWGWAERRRPAPRFEPTTGTRQGLMQRLAHGADGGHAAAPADPLVQYLLDGLPADAQPTEPGRLPWAVPARMDGRDYLDLAPWRTLQRPAATPAVDVIVPVYAGAQETLRCLWSVLASPVDTPFELVVIDDCSPEPALSAHLRALAQLGLVRLLVNERNRGFVATVNLGLALHWDRDVVILNSDTRVHPGWLDRLAAHGVAEPRAASVTPLSNNATVCSYPRMLHSNWERLELDDAALDALAAQANRGRHVEVPTGVGFCMWMRRSALDAVGLLDTERFGRGYGEENDWCMRANGAGWVQLIASDVYVLHQGSVSFRAEASERTRAGLAVLLQRHPDYQLRIDDWIKSDPLLHERARLDAARLKRAVQPVPGGGVVLMVNHARGGGTARHEAEEAARLRTEHGWGVVTLHPSRRAGCVALGPTGAAGGALDLPALQALPLLDPDSAEARPSPLLQDVLAMLDLREVQLHHLVDHPPELREVLPRLRQALSVPLSVTVHDYHLICPRINLVDASGRYCGEPDRDSCNRCLQRDELGRAAGRIGPWRAAHAQLLARADRVIVPDLDVASRLSQYFPSVRAQVKPHEALVLPAQRPPRGPVREVLVIGALSEIKGYRVLLGLAHSRVAADAGLRFTLLGHSPDDGALRAAGVQVLGRYDDAVLAERIQALAPDLILLPSVWPETFCYVLTTAAASGRRLAVFDLGAQARRLKEAGADAVYLPIELAGQPEVLAQLLLASAP